jgi:hypothetical protein
MATLTASANNQILRQQVLGSRRLSNYLMAIAVSIGGIGFLLAGISSYTHVNLLPVGSATELIFFPQGLAMTFYGVAGVLLCSYLWLTIALDVGGGSNEFNQETGKIKIFRRGFWGKNRQLEVVNSIKDVQAIKVEIREGLNPRRQIYLKIKGKGEIPLMRVGQPMALSELENQGAELAKFLGVPLEGL